MKKYSTARWRLSTGTLIRTCKCAHPDGGEAGRGAVRAGRLHRLAAVPPSAGLGGHPGVLTSPLTNDAIIKALACLVWLLRLTFTCR
jgi:hypothetical protein